MRNVLRVLGISVLVNLILAGIKLAAGTAGQSSAMISDGFHSMADTFCAVIIIAGFKLAGGNKANSGGYERLERIAAMAMAAFLFITGLLIGWAGLRDLFFGADGSAEIRGALPMAAAIAAICIKEIMYRYANAQAKRLSSKTLLAEAWHHRSDSFTSVGSFIGTAGAWFGIVWLDPLAGVLISLLIAKVAVGIFRESFSRSRVTDVKHI